MLLLLPAKAHYSKRSFVVFDNETRAEVCKVLLFSLLKHPKRTKACFASHSRGEKGRQRQKSLVRVEVGRGRQVGGIKRRDDDF
jgi:hypothetical protein